MGEREIDVVRTRSAVDHGVARLLSISSAAAPSGPSLRIPGTAPPPPRDGQRILRLGGASSPARPLLGRGGSRPAGARKGGASSPPPPGVATRWRPRASVREPASSEVSIRRRPPNGPDLHSVGTDQFAFRMEAITPEGERVDNEANKPVNILEEIVWYKDVELQEEGKVPLELCARRSRTPCARLRRRDQDVFETTGQPGLIAEVKKASPSKGVIQPI